MAEVTDDTIEYATVERLGAMLGDLREPYKVTESYALFTAILCWILQRIRTPEQEDGENDELARSVRCKLEQIPIDAPPWSVKTTPQEEGELHRNAHCFPAFAGLSAFDFFKSLRDVVAHGDARAIRPVNVNGFLVGHEFDCERRRGEPIGTITLYRADMQRLGVGLVDLFCQTMQQTIPERHVAENAHMLREEAMTA